MRSADHLHVGFDQEVVAVPVSADELLGVTCPGRDEDELPAPSQPVEDIIDVTPIAGRGHEIVRRILLVRCAATTVASGAGILAENAFRGD